MTLHHRIIVSVVAALGVMGSVARGGDARAEGGSVPEVQNATWGGSSVLNLKWATEGATTKPLKKGKLKGKFPDTFVVGQEASFVQRFSEGSSVRGTLATTDDRKFTTTGEGFEAALGVFIKEQLTPALEGVDTASLTFETMTLAGSFKLNKILTKANGKQTILFSAVFPPGDLEGLVLSGSAKVTFKGTRNP
jgi:hypothetical protein